MTFLRSVRTFLAAVPLALLATLGGCSSSNSSDNSGAAADFAAKFCDLLAPCCARLGLPTDGNVCRQLENPFNGLGYDPTAGNACLTEMRAAQSKPDFCEAGNANAPSCGKIYPSSGGSKNPGEPCNSTSDCAKSTKGKVSCESKTDAGGAKTSICQLQLAGKEGDGPCSGTVDGSVTYGSGYGSGGGAPPSQAYLCDVKDGVYCPSSSTAEPSPKCTHIGNAGEACGSSFGSYQCVKGAYCDTTDKTCKARIAVGGDCKAFSSTCVEGANCDETTQKCTPGLAEGADCTTSSQCASDNCNNKKCAKAGSITDLGYLLICGPPKATP